MLLEMAWKRKKRAKTATLRGSRKPQSARRAAEPAEFATSNGHADALEAMRARLQKSAQELTSSRLELAASRETLHSAHAQFMSVRLQLNIKVDEMGIARSNFGTLTACVKTVWPNRDCQILPLNAVP